jgi:hypothetical protein
MQKERPPVLLVFGILNIVGGALGLVNGVFALLVVVAGTNWMTQGNSPQAIKQREMQERIEKTLEEKIPFQKPLGIFNTSFDMLLSLAMVLSGIGLIKVQPWGRTLGIGYAIGSLLEKVFLLIVSVLFTIPATFEVTSQMTGPFGNAQQDQMFTTIIKGAVIFGLVVNLALGLYPLVLLIILNRASVKAVFQQVDTDAVAEAP